MKLNIFQIVAILVLFGTISFAIHKILEKFLIEIENKILRILLFVYFIATIINTVTINNYILYFIVSGIGLGWALRNVWIERKIRIAKIKATINKFKKH